jgi:hypothetical protein
MKISQPKNYKKPLYAIGLATALMAVSLTGCTDPDKAKNGGNSKDGHEAEIQEICETITAGIVSIIFE